MKPQDNTAERNDGAPRLQVALLFLFFFLVITAFWCLKPLRTAGVVKALGPEIYPLVKQGSLLLIPLVMLSYEWLTNLFSTGRVATIFGTFFLLLSIGFRLAYAFLPGAASKIGFFYFVDIYATVMVTLFWTYLNASFSSQQAKRYYGVIGSGGILGGIFGSSIAGWMSGQLGSNIILVASGIMILLICLIHYLESRFPVVKQPALHVKQTVAQETFLQSTTQGFRLVFHSKYLLAIVVIVGFYEITSSLIDYQFNASSSASYASETQMAEFQGKVFFIGQILSFLVMTFLTPWFFKKFKLANSLLLLPITLAVGSLGFMLVPVLMMITFTIGAEMSFSYSINQASKEILYVPLDGITKVKAKAFIDMFIYRLGKTLGSTLVLAYLWIAKPFGIPPQYLMLINIVFLAVWLRAILVVSKGVTQSVETDTVPHSKAA